MGKKIVLAALVVAVLVVCFPSPAFAAFGAVDPADYITNVTIDGDTKTVVYQFTGFRPYYVDTRNKEVYSKGVIDSAYTVSTEGQVPITLTFYPFGNQFYSNLPIYKGTTIDVQEILPGANLSLVFSFLTAFEQSTNLDGVKVTYTASACCYNSKGEFLRVKTVDKVVAPIDIDGSKTVGLALNLDIAQDVAYVAVSSTYTISKAGNDFVCTVTPQPVQMAVPINMIAEQSNMMGVVNDKLDGIGDQMGEANDKLDGIGDQMGEANDKLDGIGDQMGEANDKLDDIISHPEQEKQEANQSGDSNVGELVDVIPDYSGDFVGAVKTLVSSMSYSGNVAILKIPAVHMPTIQGVWDSFQMLEPMEINFTEWFNRFPQSVLTVVRVTGTIALIGFCFRELYETIEYVLTLSGGGKKEEIQ